MDMNSFSLVLGVAGFALGLVSAFAQLRAMTLIAVRFGGDKARRWASAMDADASTFAASPSAFVAYLAQCVLFFVALTLALLIVGGLSKDPALAFPRWVSPTVNFLLGGWMGLKLALIQSIVRSTRRKATESQLASSLDG